MKKRDCIRCGAKMVDKNDIRSQDSDISLVITDKRKKWWLGGDKTLKVAVCPKCGEVSFYIDP